MLKQNFLVLTAFVIALVFSVQANTFAVAAGKKKQAKFTVRIENISSAEGLTAQDGSKYPFALSPGFWTASDKPFEFFKLGKKASAGLEAQAEDGNPAILSQLFSGKITGSMGVFNMPSGTTSPAPILPNGSYEFSFTAAEGMKLNFVAMYGQSNDLFYAPEQAINLFENGSPISGDVTGKFMLYDAGTEVNQAPGIGNEQAPRQKAPNTGTAENGVVGLVKDSFTYPNTKDVLRITISNE